MNDPMPAPSLIEFPVVESSSGLATVDVVGAPPTRRFTFEDLRFLWAAGALAGLIHLLVGAVRLSLVVAASHPSNSETWKTFSAAIAAEYGLGRHVRLLQSRNPSILVTWGLLRPGIVLPAGASEWTGDRVQVVLSHELAHIQRLDWFIHIVAELLRAILWFNPLLWMVCARLRIESEYACDDVALMRGIDSSDYARHLLELARVLNIPGVAWSTALDMARTSTLERRFQAMLNSSINRRPVTNTAMMLTVVAMLGLALPIATFSSEPPPGAAAAPRIQLPVPAGEGSFSGTVVDFSAAVIPGVSVSLEHVTGWNRTTLTNELGIFRFQSVPNGSYRLLIRLPGFKTLNIDGIIISGATVYSNPIRIAISAMSEELTVTSTANTSSQEALYAPRECVALPPPPPLQPVSTQPGRIRQGGDLQQARLLGQVRPIYPTEAKTAGVQGAVIVEMVVGRNGRVMDVRVVSGHPLLASAATDAISLWCYEPTLLNGQPVEVVAVVSLNFVLQ